MDMKPNRDMENNHFDFHLDELIKLGYIQKLTRGYKLTNSGKEYANRMDTDIIKVTQQAKIGTMLCCRREDRSESQYLIYTRLKQPFYGCQGFPTGKVKFGEKAIDTARRELKEETGLSGNPKLVAIKHYLVYDKENELVEDKFMFTYLIDSPTGQFKPDELEGKYEWVNESDLKKYVTNHFESWKNFANQIKMLKEFDGNVAVEEIEHLSEKF